jgi:hypothetical protein
MVRLSIMCGALFCAVSCFADNVTIDWQKGNSFYEAKQYDSAVYYFDLIAQTRPANAAVYYNLGNAYYRLNEVPLAILNYCRALKVNPEYREAEENLTLAESRISNKIPYIPDVFFLTWWHWLTDGHRATLWAVVSWVLFLSIIAALLQRALSKDRSKRLPAQLPLFVGLAWVVCLTLAICSSVNSASSTEAVVMQNDVPLMNIDLKGKPISLVPAGTIVVIKGENSGWLEVRLPDGRVGWLQTTNVARV